MLLRTRVLLITLAFGLAILAGVAVERQLREELIREQLARAVITDRATLWRKTVENLVQRMEDKLWIVSEDEALRGLLVADDRAGLGARAGELTVELQQSRLATRLDLADLRGDLLFSSSPSLFPTPILSAAATRRVIDTPTRVRGIANDAERNAAVVVGFPLRDGERVIGAGVMATAIDEALEEMKASTDTEVLFVNRRARLLAGTAPALWDTLTAERIPELAEKVQIVDLGSSVQSLTMIPVAAELGNLVGWLVMVKDITAEHAQQARLWWLSATLLGVFMLVSLATLYLYLRHALAPLGRAVGVLNALAQGDTSVYLENDGRNDEVGRIGLAVTRLRKEVMAFERLRRAREKQRMRQERFIRREMAGLADTLEPAAREEVVGEIAEIEAMIEAGRRSEGREAAQGADGLSLMALVFEKMAARVRDQQTRMGELIEELRKALATRTAYLALQKELEIARRVQISILPQAFPPTAELEVVGRMVPAREVGGDFYDFFELEPGRIGIVVADVSGKGVPAALFMAISRTLLRAVAQRFERPGPCLGRLNDLLIQNNQEEMFVTVFYGIFDRRTGRLVYANGGHNPPMLLSGGKASPLPPTGGMALAVIEGEDYADRTIQLQPGDTIVLYTDGVTEAMDAAGEEYGMDRLGDRLVIGQHDTAVALLERLMDDLAAFAGEEPQADDITCLALRFHRASVTTDPRPPTASREDAWSAASSEMATS